MIALPFCNLSKKLPKPLGSKYLPVPVTLGEKLRNRRLELRILQREVATQLGVCVATVTLWEGNKSFPYIEHYPKIISFLGYFPWDIDTSTLAGKIKKYRYVNGLSQEELANQLGVNESTVFHYEKGTHTPLKKIRMKLEPILKAVEEMKM